MRGEPYSGFAADVWSAGVVLYNMLASDMPFNEQDVCIMAKGFAAFHPIKFPSYIFRWYVLTTFLFWTYGMNRLEGHAYI